jgi:hypothetical protein
MDEERSPNPISGIEFVAAEAAFIAVRNLIKAGLVSDAEINHLRGLLDTLVEDHEPNDPGYRGISRLAAYLRPTA